MPLHPIQSFFTAKDDDFLLKGARDPLGFQVVWQDTARQVVAYLNTVCGNLRDWQILCYGHILHQKLGTGEDLIPFFIRFEQLMAHARLASGDNSFNGIEKAKAMAAAGGVYRRLGNRNNKASKYPEAELLTNQRSYGIWGKYSTPFKGAQLQHADGFETLFGGKLERLLQNDTAKKLLHTLKKQEGAQVRAEDLNALDELLQLEAEEAQFFRKYLLQHSKEEHFQNRLYEFCEQGQIPNNLFGLLGALQQHAAPDFKSALEDIYQTETVLCPINRAFRTVQSRAMWAMADVEANDYFTSCFTPVSTEGLAGEYANKKAQFASWLSLPAKGALEAMLAENDAVAQRRGGSPWMSLRGNLLEVHHMEGNARYKDDYQQGVDSDNPYFLGTYTSLFQQAATL